MPKVTIIRNKNMIQNSPINLNVNYDMIKQHVNKQRNCALCYNWLDITWLLCTKITCFYYV